MKAKKLKVSKRTSGYVKKTLCEYEELMLLGYTDRNFCNIGRCLEKIEGHLFLSEIKLLEELWRDTYTDSCPLGDMHLIVAEISDRF